MNIESSAPNQRFVSIIIFALVALGWASLISVLTG